MDTVNYIELLEKCNKNRKNIELPKSEYKTVYGENIKGVMFGDRFYSLSEYEKMRNQEDDTIEKRIAKINEEIQKLIEYK